MGRPVARVVGVAVGLPGVRVGVAVATAVGRPVAVGGLVGVTATAGAGAALVGVAEGRGGRTVPTTPDGPVGTAALGACVGVTAAARLAEAAGPSTTAGTAGPEALSDSAGAPGPGRSLPKPGTARGRTPGGAISAIVITTK